MRISVPPPPPAQNPQAVRNGGVPVLSVRLQEMFGFSGRPNIAGVPLRLTLTDPGGKAIQARTGGRDAPVCAEGLLAPRGKLSKGDVCTGG